MLKEYSELLDKIASCSLPLALKIEAFGTMALAKIEHHFCNMYITEEQLNEFDRAITSCLRKIFNINKRPERPYPALPYSEKG